MCTFHVIEALLFALLTEKKHRSPSCAEELCDTAKHMSTDGQF